MAKAIATVGGIALAPGISKNRRLYTREMLADAVAKGQERIAAGEAINITDRQQPLSQLTHHAADDDSVNIVGRVTSLRLDEAGNARFTADIADTPAGNIIASLMDTSDGRPPFLKGVSIRGYWTGKVRKESGPDGKPVETADGLTLDGLDYTKSPGVPAAGVDTFSWMRGGKNETTERVLITESVQEPEVTFTEGVTCEGDAGSAHSELPEGDRGALREALGSIFQDVPHVFENGFCVTCH